jgi:hypothetical protein
VRVISAWSSILDRSSLPACPIPLPPTSGSPSTAMRAGLPRALTCLFVAASGAAALPKITRQGRFLYDESGSRFYIKGIGYQPAGTQRHRIATNTMHHLPYTVWYIRIWLCWSARRARRFRGSPCGQRRLFARSAQAQGREYETFMGTRSNTCSYSPPFIFSSGSTRSAYTA